MGSRITESRIFLKDARVRASVGVYAHEKQGPQDILINVEVDVIPNDQWASDDIQHVMSYDDVLAALKDTATEGHIELLETFAEKIIERIFANERAQGVTVQIEKPGIFPEVRSAGIQIQRRRQERI